MNTIPNMEPPLKRRRLSGKAVPDADLQKRRARNDGRLKSIFESIFDKYGKDFKGISDEVDLMGTGEIVINNGHLLGMGTGSDAQGRMNRLSEEVESDYSSDEEEVGDADNVLKRALTEGSSVQEGEVVVKDSGNLPLSVYDVNSHLKGACFDTPSQIFEKSLLGQLKDYESEEDELADKKIEWVTPRQAKAISLEKWQLPAEGPMFLDETASDPTWYAPPLPTPPSRSSKPTTPYYHSVRKPTSDVDKNRTCQDNNCPGISVWGSQADGAEDPKAINSHKVHEILVASPSAAHTEDTRITFSSASSEVKLPRTVRKMEKIQGKGLMIQSSTVTTPNNTHECSNDNEIQSNRGQQLQPDPVDAALIDQQPDSEVSCMDVFVTELESFVQQSLSDEGSKPVIQVAGDRSGNPRGKASAPDCAMSENSNVVGMALQELPLPIVLDSQTNRNGSVCESTSITFSDPLLGESRIVSETAQPEETITTAAVILQHVETSSPNLPPAHRKLYALRGSRRLGSPEESKDTTAAPPQTKDNIVKVVIPDRKPYDGLDEKDEGAQHSLTGLFVHDLNGNTPEVADSQKEDISREMPSSVVCCTELEGHPSDVEAQVTLEVPDSQPDESSFIVEDQIVDHPTTTYTEPSFVASSSNTSHQEPNFQTVPRFTMLDDDLVDELSMEVRPLSKRVVQSTHSSSASPRPSGKDRFLDPKPRNNRAKTGTRTMIADPFSTIRTELIDDSEDELSFM